MLFTRNKYCKSAIYEIYIVVETHVHNYISIFVETSLKLTAK